MKFVVLSHAGLLVEHNGVRVVCDPWLIGSCYWRSWWNFPEPDPRLIENLRPDFIYLTHLHWDHFHGASLKKLFDPSTNILVPKVPTSRMIDDLRWLGFNNILEVPHGRKMQLGSDFDLRSYQFGLGVDSAAVISGGGYTLFNCNDCKLFGLPLRKVMRDYPKIDFIFRSHSSASPVPFCVENYENLLPTNDDNYDSADQFARCAIYSGARYAIPFASNHCFLHPETRRFNSTATTPDVAAGRYAALSAQAGVTTECVVMPPGSSWTASSGFEIVPFDFARRGEYVEMMAERNAAKLSQQIANEATVVFDFDAFRSYFEQFLRSLPWWLRRWKMAAVTFRVKDSLGSHDYCVDPKRKSVTPRDSARPGTVVFEVHAVVLNDCARLRMFSVWSASKRLKIHLRSADALRDAKLWFALLDLYEVDLLPLRKNFSIRAMSVHMRRWREAVEVTNILIRGLVLRERFSVSRLYPLPGLSPP